MNVISRKINIHIFLISILLIFVLSNILGVPNVELDFLPYPFEKSIIELIQSVILLSTIFIYIKSRKFFIKRINSLIYYLKLILMIFLVYEENSFFTKGLSSFFNKINGQGEINFHNLYILDNLAFTNIYIYGLDSYFDITISGLITFVFLGLMGFGSLLWKSKNIIFFTFNRKFSFYTLFCFIELSISFLLKEILHFKIDLITWEETELFIYILWLVDTIYKARNKKRIRNQS